MKQTELQAAYAKFLDASVCLKVEEELRSLIHTAFVAGWCAAQNSNRPAEEETDLSR